MQFVLPGSFRDSFHAWYWWLSQNALSHAFVCSGFPRKCHVRRCLVVVMFDMMCLKMVAVWQTTLNMLLNETFLTIWIWLKLFFLMLLLTKICLGPLDGFEPNRRQTIIWNNVGLVKWRGHIYVNRSQWGYHWVWQLSATCLAPNP